MTSGRTHDIAVAGTRHPRERRRSYFASPSRTCRRWPSWFEYRGDGHTDVDAMGQCDDGLNQSSYGQPGYAPGCRIVPRCGDGKVDGAWGEECDDGNTTSRDGCGADCRAEIG